MVGLGLRAGSPARITLVLFSLGYLGLRRVLELMVWFRRSDLDKDLEILVLRHQLSVLQRQLGGRVLYRPADRVILAALARTLPGFAGARSWSPHRRCCGGSASWRLGSGDAGGGNGGVVARQWHPSWSS